MKKWCFIALFCVPVLVWSQNWSGLAGGRSAALAHSSVALRDVWASHHNQAGLARQEAVQAGLSYERRYFLPDLNLGQMALAVPVSQGTLGLAVSRFGFDLFHQSKVGLSYARPFGPRVAASLQVNYHQQYIEELQPQRSALSFEAGLMLRPLEELHLGFHIFNPNRSFLHREAGERLPFIGRLGAHYTLGEEVALTGEFHKQLFLPEQYRLGMEWKWIENIYLRTGLALQPWQVCFGLGYDWGPWQINASYQYARLPGSNANFSLQYRFE